MRVKAIGLSWFRGAADPVSLEPDCKSMVVYGVNGSGKSSFVDAVEYILNKGKIGHLTHEYSGRRQEKAVPNTHTPKGQETALSIKFKDDSELKVDIGQDGSRTYSSGEAAVMPTWDYRRTVLRQDEVAAFICNTKGDKYSALLPLFGLHRMEIAAENLRQIAKGVEVQSKLKEFRVRLKEVKAKREETFGTDSNTQVLTKIKELQGKYCADKTATADTVSLCKELETALDMRVAESSTDQRRHVLLSEAAALDLEGHVEAVRVVRVKLADAAEPLIVEKLAVLQPTGVFVEKLEEEKEVDCPACGRSIPVDAFQAHVKAEQERLREIIDTFDTHKAAIRTLCDTVKSLKTSLGKDDVKSWWEELAKGPLADNVSNLEEINTETLRASCGKEDLKTLEDKLLPLIDAAAAASKDAPAAAKQLTDDKQIVAVASAVIAAEEQAAAVARAEALLSFIKSLEEGVREEIRQRSEEVIKGISKDIQAMWAILHPGETIEGVRLYLPEDADKAIDIGLKFHGVKQDSPRLTLSEGYRNSLGLCIFLAMAKRERDTDGPIFLDDVVVSLDRNHRGMIVELLQKEFSERQVVILTHDREWYTELRQQLDGNTWTFKTLLPYETPDIGIRWSHKTTTFDDARAHIADRPDSAGNDARKIMDVELALIAERLQIRVPYLRADRNDKRTAHEFLGRFVAGGKKCFQIKRDEDYVAHMDAIDVLKKADELLVTWGNQASHTFDVVRPEANKLINACEEALEAFKCSSCGKNLWFTDAARSKWVQCQCGQVRWRYGKE